jgi:hypothetical protein
MIRYHDEASQAFPFSRPSLASGNKSNVKTAPMGLDIAISAEEFRHIPTILHACCIDLLLLLWKTLDIRQTTLQYKLAATNNLVPSA